MDAQVALNDRWLPPEFLAEEYTHAGSRLEIDVATYQDSAVAAPKNGPPSSTVTAPTWAPPARW